MRNLFQLFQSQKEQPSPADPLEIITDQERRKVFLRYLNNAWLLFGVVTLATLPIFPEQRSVFIFLIALTFPTYLIVRLLNMSGATRLAGVVFTLCVNIGFYGLFMVLVGKLGASKAFETESTVWMLMGLAVLFAGAFVDKWAAPGLALINTILLIGTRLTIAPDSSPRPGPVVFWWMMALTIWLYEGTLHEALRRTRAERKHADKAIQEAELKYRLLVERLPVAIYTSELGVNGKWHYISPQIKHLLGFTDEEWIADPGLWYRQIHPDDRNHQQELEEQAWARQEPFEGEYRMFTLDGRLIWVRDSAQILPPQDNSAPIVQGVLMNITDRKQAEETIQTMNILLEQTLEQSPVPMVLVSMPDGIIRSANSACRRFLGVDDEPSPVGTPLSELKISWQDFDMQGNPGTYEELPLPRSLMGLRTDPQERRIVRKDGTSVYGLVYGSPIFDTAGKLIAGYLVMIDITERKLSEDALAASEAELRALFTSMQDIVLVIDRDGVYRKIAPTNPDLLYKPLQEMLDKKLWDIFPTEQADTFNSAIQQVLKTRQTARIEYELPIGNHLLWFAASISPMDEDNTLWVIRDITERKQAEQMQAALYQIANVAQTTLSLNELFASIHKTLGTFMPAENFYIAIYDAQNDLLSFPYFVDEYDTAPLPQKPGNGLTEYILRMQQPLLATPQVFEEMINSKKVDSLGIPSVDWMGVPLTVGNETFGVMVVQTYTDKVRLTQKDLELLTFVSTQAAMVIKRKQAEEALRQRTSQLEALREIGLELTAELDLDKLLNSITAHALALLHSTGGGIYLYRPEQQKLEWVVAIGVDITPLGTSLKYGDGLSGKVWEQRKPIIVDDYEHWEGRAAVYEGKPFKAVMGVPIIKGGEFLGVLVLLADHPQSFSVQDASLLELFAGYAAVAIHNARLYQNARQRLIELEVLYKTSNALSVEHDLNTLLRSIVENARKLLNVATSGMYLTIPNSDELELSMDTAPYIPLGSRIRFGEGVAGRVAQTRQPLRVDDYSTWEGRSPLYKGKPIRAVLEVPMLYRGELIGVLTADEAGESKRKFTEADEHLLSLIASQAAGAIQSARLYQNARQRLIELEVLYETSNTLSAEHELKTLLRSIVENARKLLSSATSGMYLSIPGSDELELSVDTAPYITLGKRVSPGKGIAGRVAQTRKPIRIDDYSIWEDRSPQYEGVSIRAVLEVPMLYRGELIGVLIADETGESERKFTEEDEHLLSLFASQAAGAIHSARLFEEVRRRAEEFKGLYQTTRDLSIQHDLPAVLTIITQQATTLLNVQNASITLYDPLRVDLELVASIGPDLPIGTRRKVGDGLAGQVAQSGKPLVVDDYQHWENRSPLYDAIPYTAMMGVPLLYGGNLLGVLDVSDIAPSARTFNDADVRLLSLFAGQAASAIANARLFEETVRRLENLQSLRTIDNAISGSADVDLILEVILGQVISQLGADAAVILLFDPGEQTLEYAAGRGFRTQALQHTYLRLGEGYAGRVAQERKTKHIQDIRAIHTDFLRSPTLSQEGFISYYGVPLIAKGEIKGVLEVFHRTSFDAENDWLNFLETLAGQTAIAIDNTALYKGLQLSNIELTLAYDATIEGWSRALDLRDKETEGHTQRVTEITINLAKAMGISEAELVNIRRGALLHDIGKMGVPDSILLKAGKLTKEEWEIMHKHPFYAYEMLTPIAYLKTALDIPYCHHEKWDGTGYPNGLKGEDIPLAARIFAVVDVWDAICSDRPYRQGWDTKKAIEYIKSQSGSHFDPKIVDAFLNLLHE